MAQMAALGIYDEDDEIEEKKGEAEPKDQEEKKRLQE